MKYYDYQTYEVLPIKTIRLLDKFPDSFGVCVTLDLAGEIENIEFSKIRPDGTGTIWTHYANVMEANENEWELNEQFITIDEEFCDNWGDEYRKWIGTEQTAMNIYGTFKSADNAIRNLLKYGTSENGRKAKSVYV